jgi:hypothetical protein
MRRVLLLFVCAAAATGQPDSGAILSRIRARVQETRRGLPRYACIETVTRDYYTAVAPLPRSCELVIASREHPTPDLVLRRSSTDRLRLEVAMARNGELHSWAGDREFLGGNIDMLIREGPLGSGAFSGFLAALFEVDVKDFRLLQLTPDGGRRAARFAFAVPAGDSHYRVKVGTEWKPTAYAGEFEADSSDGELSWLQVTTAILPQAAGTCQTTTRVNLGRTAIGNGQFLVTTSAQQDFEIDDGGRVVNRIEYSGCREYASESNIRFETDGTLHSGAGVRKDGAVEEIPVGLQFTLALGEALDTATAAAGDRFTARLDSPIRNYLGDTFAPRNAVVRGRILRVQSYYGKSPESVFVLRPETVEVKGVEIPLVAERDSGIAEAQKGAMIYLPSRSETHAGLFRFLADHAVLPRGFITHWITTLR